MARLPSVNWQDVVRVFEKAGWQHDRSKASHYIMVRPRGPGLLSVPMYMPVKRGTLRKLIRESGLTVDAFVSLL
jgi:predicted RNA binding protein YcfA (HicA-like mRNA interferase family)